MLYVGTTFGAGLELGDTHELRLSAGPAIYRAEVRPDFFTGVVSPAADSTDGFVPAAIIDARYIFRAIEQTPLELGFGGGLRAVIPASASRGDPTLVMAHVFMSLGAL